MPNVRKRRYRVLGCIWRFRCRRVEPAWSFDAPSSTDILTCYATFTILRQNSARGSAEAELASHQLLIRANFIRSAGAGVYTFMPFGYRVIRKIWDIMAAEMDAISGRRCGCPICTGGAVAGYRPLEFGGRAVEA